MGIKRNNAVGLKGRSGRKSASVEFAKNQAIQKAWEKVNKDIDKEDTVKIALPIALRDMVDKREHSGEVKITPIYAGKSVETVQEYTGNGENLLPEEED